jgi:predicted enzyme involved in methoxymalonyl-ACP biosynthesis
VINRTVEESLFAALLEEARRQGFERLVGRYIPTAKNMLVAGLFERLGFVGVAGGGAAGADERVYELALDAVPPIKTFVQWRKDELETSSAS